MSASGNRPASVSPPPRPRTSTQWQTTTAPPPAQPLSPQPPQPPLANSRQQHATNTTTANGDNDISLRQILERYKDDPELLKHILKAKVEEDKVWIRCEICRFLVTECCDGGGYRSKQRLIPSKWNKPVFI